MLPPREGDRLRFRTVTLDDSSFLRELVNDADYLRFIGDRNIRDDNDARAYIREKFMPAYDGTSGTGVFICERKTDGAAIGIVTLLHRDGFRKPDIGYALLPQWRGLGYGLEGANALLNYARQRLGLTTLCAIATPDNRASLRLLEKLGFIRRGFVRNNSSGKSLLLLDWTCKAP